MTSSEPTLQAIRGMNDILPGEIALWQKLEDAAREVFAAYGYSEMRVPIVEQTALFKRSIGELTDVVSKEMYSFEDRGGEQITLRPEATAGLVRAMIAMVSFTISANASGAWARCFAMRSRKRAAFASFIRSMSRPLVLRDPMSMQN